MPTFAKATDAKGDRASLLSLHPIAACEAVNSVGFTASQLAMTIKG
ncbi:MULTISPECIES: hypothetical protein [Kamptonema]|nr:MULTISPECIES: hypothetical protein [Kamptonema]